MVFFTLRYSVMSVKSGALNFVVRPVAFQHVHMPAQINL